MLVGKPIFRDGTHSTHRDAATLVRMATHLACCTPEQTRLNSERLVWVRRGWKRALKRHRKYCFSNEFRALLAIVHQRRRLATYTQTDDGETHACRPLCRHGARCELHESLPRRPLCLRRRCCDGVRCSSCARPVSVACRRCGRHCCAGAERCRRGRCHRTSAAPIRRGPGARVWYALTVAIDARRRAHKRAVDVVVAARVRRVRRLLRRPRPPAACCSARLIRVVRL